MNTSINIHDVTAIHVRPVEHAVSGAGPTSWREIVIETADGQSTEIVAFARGNEAGLELSDEYAAEAEGGET